MSEPKKFNKLRGYVNLIDSAALGIYISLSIFFKSWMMAIGKFSLLLFPLFDGLRLFTKIYNFHLKHTNNQLQHKDYVSLVIYMTKFTLASVGMGLVLGAGMPVLGFSLAIVGIFLVALTALYKTIRDLVKLGQEDASPNLISKISNNALNTVTLAILGASFTLLTFVPTAALIAYGMLLVVSALSMTRMLPMFLTAPASAANLGKKQEPDAPAIVESHAPATTSNPNDSRGTDDPRDRLGLSVIDHQTAATQFFCGFCYDRQVPTARDIPPTQLPCRASI